MTFLSRTAVIISRANPWSLIALIFGAQAVGASVAARQFQMGFAEIALPIALLVAGTVVSVLMRLLDRSPEVRSWKWWFPAAIYAVFIFFLSNRSYPDAHITVNVKVFHILEYITLGMYVSWAWHDVADRKGVLLFLIRVLPACAIFAMSDEFHQTFIAGRTGRVTDVLIDLVGAAAGSGLMLIYRQFRTFGNESPIPSSSS